MLEDLGKGLNKFFEFRHSESVKKEFIKQRIFVLKYRLKRFQSEILILVLKLLQGMNLLG